MISEKFYECAVCLTLNHSIRLHCQNCGTVPTCYSIIRKPARLVVTPETSYFVEVIRARGCFQVSLRRARRMYLYTVPATYYAEV